MSVVLIVCGGTGGHLSPGIALAEALGARGHECLLLVSEKGVDARLLEKYPKLQFLRAPGTGLKITAGGVLHFAIETARSLLFSLRLVRARRPAVLVAFGGFLSIGPTLAARLMGTPVALHEANRVAGKAVRALSRFAARVWVPAGVAVPRIAARALRSAGFPVREEIVPLPAAAARRSLGFPQEGCLLLVIGGSQGAAPLNEWALRNREKFFAAGVHVLCVTGQSASSAAPAANDAVGGGIVFRCIPFCDRMADVLSAADLAVSRAGAGTVAEFVVCALPSILVPYPQAADKHQDANACHLEKLGGCRVLPQNQIATTADPAASTASTEHLTAEVLRLLQDAAALAVFRENLRAARGEFAWQHIVADIEQLMRK
ncbi:MAG: UDP-N-acetylglucosamine--N-acetylmuramyl-(pentapeptide) pyrophosphoryl-undecaprenol N-acetylglucosamine transferase [Puniceicoccales bacterium]|jgi:UDP-N-acetylglucosamine--N-acetylmuramyl-(pentapeptide) pyrophosphoryl-undecaprenol N-acetylglucosamine transferase|nr:UDP-N-acetylglucosamine--N-acetylmuramyl-(pentapeptide) pyrophosphoryl-undecaprenol N-acetylglucosamine transferase [Puniceicoccales bacterium]